MQTIEVTFQKNYHTSFEDRFLMETIIILKSVDIGEDTQQVIDKAREEIELNHRRNNPHLFPPDIPIIPKKEDGITFKEHQETISIADQISSCTDRKTLLTYDFVLKNHSEYKLNTSLRELYNQKLKELQ